MRKSRIDVKHQNLIYESYTKISFSKAIFDLDTENVMALRDLIDQATEAAGSQTKLAELIGVQQQNISGWRTGRRVCTTQSRIELCKIAGYDLKTALIEQVIEGLDQADQVQAEAGAMLRAILDAFPQEKSFRKKTI